MIIITWCTAKEKADLQGLPLSPLLRFDVAKHWITSASIEINGSWMSSAKSWVSRLRWFIVFKIPEVVLWHQRKVLERAGRKVKIPWEKKASWDIWAMKDSKGLEGRGWVTTLWGLWVSSPSSQRAGEGQIHGDDVPSRLAGVHPCSLEQALLLPSAQEGVRMPWVCTWSRVCGRSNLGKTHEF